MKKNKILKMALGAMALLLLVAGSASPALAQSWEIQTVDEPARTDILQDYARLPVLFVENHGQLDAEVEYYAKTSGQTIYLTDSILVFDLIRHEETDEADLADGEAERLVFSLGFVGADESPVMEGKDQDKAVVNYFIGNDPEKWYTSIPTYREVMYNDIYPGIDLRLYGKEGCLEYEFVVEPGASIADIALAYAGVDSLTIKSDELVVSTAFGNLKQSQPYIYQQIGNDRVEVEGGFRLLEGNSYGFEVGAYDASYPLIIDPSLAYSTYLGGSDDDPGLDIAVESGCAYVTGRTYSSDFPTQNQYQTYQSPWDTFVTKLDTTQSGAASLVYSTYLGGSGNDWAYGIAVESGYAYVTGYTDSTDFPTLNQYQADQGDRDTFVTKLDTTQSGAASLIYSTYLGGSSGDYGKGIAVESGCAYVTGETDSTDFPTKNQYQADQGVGDVFVTKLDTTQSGAASLVYSTYLGGSMEDIGNDIAVESGYAYVTGWTESIDFPTLNQYQTAQEDRDVFVTKIDTTQSGTASLIYSTYLGGSDIEYGHGIAVESGCAYVVGYTFSTDFPTKNQYQTDQGDSDIFVTKIDTTQSGTASLIYSTYLGGSDIEIEWGHGIAVESGCAYVTGGTDSTDFPTLNQYQADQGDRDTFVAKLDTTQSAAASLIYSTYLGGSYSDTGYGIAVESGCAYVTGSTSSTDFPTLNQYQTDQGGSDAFVTKLGEQGPNTPPEVMPWIPLLLLGD